MMALYGMKKKKAMIIIHEGSKYKLASDGDIGLLQSICHFENPDLTTF
jgi:hypothetical protein